MQARVRKKKKKKIWQVK